MYREYTSIVQTRFACKIDEKGEIEPISPGVSLYRNKVGAVTQLEEFVHAEGVEPKPGDYIVKTPDGKVVLAAKDHFEKNYRSTGFILR